MAIPSNDWTGLVLAGRYLVRSRLGEGGMGFVYRVHDRNLDTDVVVKVPRRSMLDDPEFAERFAREVRALVCLAHPGIVRITDVGEHDGLPFAVMQYLAGGSLEDRRPITDGRPVLAAPGTLAGWLPAIAEALDFVHRSGYVHRDVKPGNVLFDAHGHALLGDFGVAKVVTGSKPTRGATGAGIIVGTPEYMAPELIMGRPFDGRADQYALAVMAFELLAGRRPFDGDSPTAILVQHTVQEPPELQSLVPGLPAALAATVHRGLAKDPARRFPDCASFARAAMAALPGRPARPASGAAPARLACPGCGAAFAVTEALAGRRGRCRACGCRVQIAEDLSALAPIEGVASGGTMALAPARPPTPAPRSGRPAAPPTPAERTAGGTVRLAAAKKTYDMQAPPPSGPDSPVPFEMVDAPTAGQPAPGRTRRVALTAGAAAGMAVLGLVLAVVASRYAGSIPQSSPPSLPGDDREIQAAATLERQQKEAAERRRLANLLNAAEQAIRSRRMDEAARSLREYRDSPAATDRARASALLADIEAATDGERAARLFRPLRREELAGPAGDVVRDAYLARFADADLRGLAAETLGQARSRELARREPVAARSAGPEPPAPAPTPPAPAPARVDRGPARVALAELIADPEAFDGRTVIPTDYVFIGTRAARLPDGRYTLPLANKDRKAVSPPRRGQAPALVFALDPGLLSNLAAHLRAHNIRPSDDPTNRAILTLKVEPGGDSAGAPWRAVIWAMEVLVSTDAERIAKGAQDQVFGVLRLDPNGRSIGHGDGPDWIERLGGPRFTELVRRKYRDRLNQIRIAREKAAVAPLERSMATFTNRYIQESNMMSAARLRDAINGRMSFR